MTNKESTLKFNREQIKRFLEEYFQSYSTIAQDPEKNHQMLDYYAPNIIVYLYAGDVLETNFEDFLILSSSHPSIQETLIPEHYIIDEAQSMATVLLKGELAKKATGEVFREMDFSAHYQLTTDDNGALKITHLWIFAQYAPDGEESIFELYMNEMMDGQKGESDYLKGER